MKNFSAVAHVLASYLAGLIAIAATLGHGHITPAAYAALAPAVITATVEAVRQIGTVDPSGLAQLAALADKYGPMVDNLLGDKPAPSSAPATAPPRPRFDVLPGGKDTEPDTPML